MKLSRLLHFRLNQVIIPHIVRLKILKRLKEQVKINNKKIKMKKINKRNQNNQIPQLMITILLSKLAKVHSVECS